MSRKAREKERNGGGSTWKTPSIYGLVGNYGPLRVKGYEPIENVIVWLYHSDDHDNDNHRNENTKNPYHEMYPIAGPAQEVLLRQQNYDYGSDDSDADSLNRKKGIIVIDIAPMFDSDEEWHKAYEKEIDDEQQQNQNNSNSNNTNTNVMTRGFGKMLLRLLQRMILQHVTVMAYGTKLCTIVIKLVKILQSIDEELVNDIWLIHPSNISTKFINQHLILPPKQQPQRSQPAMVAPSSSTSTSTQQNNKKGKRKNGGVRKGGGGRSTTVTTATTRGGAKNGSAGSTTSLASIPLRLVVNSSNRRVDILRHVFPQGETFIVDDDDDNDEKTTKEGEEKKDGDYKTDGDDTGSSATTKKRTTNNDSTSIMDWMIAATKSTKIFDAESSSLDDQDIAKNDDNDNHNDKTMKKNKRTLFQYDADYCNDMGKSLFISQINVEMNRYTKQYERNCEDITSRIMEKRKRRRRRRQGQGNDDETNSNKDNSEEISIGISNIHFDYTSSSSSDVVHYIGALVLRGNRCVMVRSLNGQWKGMKFPSVPMPTINNNNNNTGVEVTSCYHAAALRAVEEFTEVDAKTEVKILSNVLPIPIYTSTIAEEVVVADDDVVDDDVNDQHQRQAKKPRPMIIHLYPLYAIEPPPDGPLEDADLEDDETLYDWYTLPNAIARLQKQAEQQAAAGQGQGQGHGLLHLRSMSYITALQTISFSLLQAANVGIVPAKWGGIFGQELYMSTATTTTTPTTTTTTTSSSSSSSLQVSVPSFMSLTAPVEEWQHTVHANAFENVQKAKNYQQEQQHQLTTLTTTMTKTEAAVPLQGDVKQEEGQQQVSSFSSSLVPKLQGRRKNNYNNGKLPVTLLSGFLGSGKTTLLSYILSNYENLRIAILVNDMGEINIDAALVKRNMNTTSSDPSSSSSVTIKQREEHMVELSNGCICCTLREDLLVEIANIAAVTDPAPFDYLIIESTGISEPLPVAETFTFEDMSSGLKLGDVAELDTLVTVVDTSKFWSELDSLQSLRERNWHADADDSRTISHLLCDQVEFANVIVLNKCDLLVSTTTKEKEKKNNDNNNNNDDGDEKQKIKQFIQSMNPTAKIIEATYSAVPLRYVLGTGLFSMSDAEKHENWLKEARIGEHTPETEEYGIGSFTYRAIKPFLPYKLYTILEHMLDKSHPPFGPTATTTTTTGIGDEMKQEQSSSSPSSSSSSSSIVLRAKGFVWLANCPQVQGDFSLAGHHFSLVPGNPWWAEIDKEHWPDGLEEGIAPLWHEPYGDRQQELVIIGQSLDKDAITEVLDGCLVSEEEFELGQDHWHQLCIENGDPFQDEWDAAIEQQQQQQQHDHSHEHGHGHGHEHGHDH